VEGVVTGQEWEVSVAGRQKIFRLTKSLHYEDFKDPHAGCGSAC